MHHMSYNAQLLPMKHYFNIISLLFLLFTGSCWLADSENNAAGLRSNAQFAQNAAADDAIKILPYDIYDFDRHARDEMGTGFHPRNWFTGFASHQPRDNGMNITDTAGWSTKASPFRPAHYPKGISDQNGMTNYRGDRGWRMVFDMTGDKDMFNLAKYKITEIYGLQQGGDGQDTLYFYNFDKIFALPAERRAMYIARCDSLMTPFARLVQKGATAWRPEWSGTGPLNDSMRYMLVVMRKKDRGFYHTFPDFSELVIYGKPLFNASAISHKNFNYNGPLPVRKTAGEILGVNNAGVELSQLQYDGNVREYIAAGSHDADTAPYPFNKINLNPWNFSRGYWEQEFGGAKAQGRMWFESTRAGSKRLEKNGWGVVAKSIPVTEGGMEPEYWQSYARFGNYFYHYAAVLGNNKNHSTSSFRFTNKEALPGFGLGYRSAVEPGNEDETRGSTILAMVVKDNVVYDGYEGRVPAAGIMKGDSTMKLIMPATVYLDTSMYKSMIFLCRLIRNDRKIIWNYFNGHHYSRQYRDPSVTEHDPTYEEMWGTKGATPEWDKMLQKLHETEKVIWRESGDTAIRLVFTEWGYENWSTASSSVAEQAYQNPFGAFWTISPTPRVAGRDSLHGKGMLMVRGESIFCATRIAWYNEYMITNSNFDPVNKPHLFGSAGRGAADGKQRNTLIPVKFPHYWARASFWNIIKDYKVDSVYSIDSLGKCLIKWRHASKPDSVIYELWKGSWNGSSIANVVVPVGVTTSNIAIKKSLSFTGPTPGQQIINFTNRQVIQTATEEPVFLHVREAGR